MPVKIGRVELFEVNEIAEKFGISRGTILTYLKKSKLSGQKMGRKWYISDTALHQFFTKKSKKTRGGAV
jgi:excisionase family DNA binding protein